MRLDRFLTRHTSYSRKQIQPILAKGRVLVDGKVEKNTQCEINEFTRIMLDGEYLQNNTAVYLMLHKPAGYLSATTDPKHPTVMELIDSSAELHLAGRLDRATTGLLLLTNDGKWSRRITDPAKDGETGIPKVYEVETSEVISTTTIQRFQQGIYFAYEDLTTQPAELEILESHRCRLTIYEGRYHQVKRMFHAVGNNVRSLHRIRIGNITLDPRLTPGEYRHLTEHEIRF
jgi:16S rRNA pseudouridine516 synthase